MTLKTMLRFRLLLPLLLLPVAAMAQGTKLWEQSKYEDLQKGTAKDVAIRRGGGLELAPSLKQLYASPSTQIWSIASDDAGNLYAGAGSPARVYRITPDGKATIVFEDKDLQVQAIAVDKSGAVYAATLPDGKVYRIAKGTATSAKNSPDSKDVKTDAKAADSGDAKTDTPKPPVDASYTSSVFFDPKTRYIWALLFDASGNLYVATGDNGEIFRVTPKGESKVFFKSDDAHIRSLALDANGNLIAGSDGSGLIYRISPAGEGFVLYGASKKEITALAVDKAGNIYASAVGERHSGGGLAQILQQPVTITVNNAGAKPGAAPLNQPNQGPLPLPAFGAASGSDVYRIASDGSPERIWSSNDDIVYTMAFDPNGRLLVGTGNKGRIFAVNPAVTGDDEYADLGRAAASQVTAFAPAPKGGLFLATSNLGKVFTLGPALATEGTYESDVFDAKVFSRWGRAELRGSNVDLFARSGNVDNPDRNWSPWSKVALTGDAKLQAPAARYLQWKAVLHPGSGRSEVNTVAVNYRSKNVAPVVEDVSVSVGARVTATPKTSGGSSFLFNASSQSSASDRYESPVPTVHDRDSIAVKWSARDANDDSLSYSVYYRGENDSRWLLLRNDLSDHWLSFEASLLPDGAYIIKVVATDADSHSPGEGLTGEKESQRFEVDTTAPRIEILWATVDRAAIRTKFSASDNSVIKRAEYSVDAGDWEFLEPVGGLSDAKSETYEFVAALSKPSASGVNTPPSDEHVLVVRVFDRYDNFATAKIVIPSPPSKR